MESKISTHAIRYPSKHPFSTSSPQTHATQKPLALLSLNSEVERAHEASSNRERALTRKRKEGNPHGNA
jgi:hypothetical protein